MRKAILLLLGMIVLSCSKSDSEPEPESPGNPQNRPPVIGNISFNTENAFQGTVLEVSATISDPDNNLDRTEWSVDEGEVSKISNFIVNWQTPELPGSYTITVTAYDTEGLSSSKTSNYNLSEFPQTFFAKLESLSRHGSNRIYTEIIQGNIFTYSSDAAGSIGTSSVLRKFNLAGEQIWQKTIESFPDDPRQVFFFERTPDNMILLKTWNGDLQKYDLEGNLIWSIPNRDFFYFSTDSSGNYILAGVAVSPISNINVPSIIKISSNGDLIDQVYLEDYSASGVPFAIAQGSGQDSFVIGMRKTNSSTGITSIVLMDVEFDGTILGEVTTEGHLPTNESQLIPNGTGKYTYHAEFRNESFITLTKVVTLDFITQDVSSFELAYGNWFRPTDMELLPTGEFLFAGSFGSSQFNTQGIYLKTDESGSEMWSKIISEFPDSNINTQRIKILMDGRLVIAGSLRDQDGYRGYIGITQSNGSLE